MRFVWIVGIAAALGVVGCKSHHVNDAPQLAAVGVVLTADKDHVEGDIVNEGETQRGVIANFAILDANGIRIGSASAVGPELQAGTTWHFVVPVIHFTPPPAGSGEATTVQVIDVGSI